MSRLTAHPIIKIDEKKEISIYYEDQLLRAKEGETVAAALLAHGFRIFRYSAKRNEPRGIFCGIGQCTDCIMEIDGKPNVRACMTIVHEGMTIRTQKGLGQ
ncbi:MAG: (2Fe-2S)-binding protein [Lachnospiraceae bacterium]|nr:(2Fe-2S)-binding protein [Lachnospiraceae bacterium]